MRLCPSSTLIFLKYYLKTNFQLNYWSTCTFSPKPSSLSKTFLRILDPEILTFCGLWVLKGFIYSRGKKVPKGKWKMFCWKRPECHDDPQGVRMVLEESCFEGVEAFSLSTLIT